MYNKFLLFLVEGENGIMGGSMSHEYHIMAPVGENILLKCTNCTFVASKELVLQKHCPRCNVGDVEEITGIEVRFTFLLFCYIVSGGIGIMIV